jgi:chaperone modulatory protein CbpM
MESREFLLRTRLDAQALETFVAAGWLAPRQRGEMREFADIDVARTWLIRDLRELGINDEGIPVVLDLIDQVHGLRRVLREVLGAMRSRLDAASSPQDGSSEETGAARSQPPAAARNQTH